MDNVIFLTNFIVLGYNFDFKMPIIMGRPFLSTSRALVNMEKGELNFILNDKEARFNVCRTMKQPTDMTVVPVINCVDDPGVQSFIYLYEF